MQDAARFQDAIEHTSAAAGLLIGLAAGAALAVAVVAVVGTGGAAAPFIAAGIAAGAAGGGLSGAYIGEVIPSTPTGMLGPGSDNVFIGGYNGNAARTAKDMSASCSGIWPTVPHVPTPIVEGSASVYINNFMAARKSDSLACGATIAVGCRSVKIGGPTQLAPGMKINSEIPGWLTYTLWGVAIGGTIIATGGAVLAAAPIVGWGAALGGAGGGLLAGFGGGMTFGWAGGEIGEEIGDYFGNPELGRRIGEVGLGTVGGLGCGVLGGAGGARLASRPPGTRFGPPARAPGNTSANPASAQTGDTLPGIGPRAPPAQTGRTLPGVGPRTPPAKTGNAQRMGSVNTRQAAAGRTKAAARQGRADLEAAGVSKRKIGPAISVAEHRPSGTMSRPHINDRAGRPPRPMDSKLKNRIPEAELQPDPNSGMPYEKSHGAGSHSEVHAVNEILQKVPNARMEEITVYTEQIGGRYDRMVKPPCPHCEYILDGVHLVK